MGGKNSGRYPRKKITTTTTTTAAEDDESVAHATALALTSSPIFSELAEGGGSGREVLDHVRVQRLGPVPEGYLGNIQPDEGIDHIYRQWGGGKYKATACTEHGKPISGGFRTLEIAGDPKFKTKAAEIEYRRMTGETGEKRGPDVVEIMLRQEESRRTDWERRKEEQESAHAREIARLRLEGELREKERKADDDRRERERRADDERRRRDDEERELRRKRESEEARKRDQEFYAAMRKNGDGADPITTLMAGIKLAQTLKGDGGGEDSPGMELVKSLPTILQRGAEMVRAGAGAMGAGAGAAPAAPGGAAAAAERRNAPAAAGAAPAAVPAEKRGPMVTLEGKTGEKARAALLHLKSIGVDPKVVLEEMFDKLALLGKVPDVNAPVAAVEAAPPAPAAPVAISAPAAPPAPLPPPAPAHDEGEQGEPGGTALPAA